jgi:hypothetical protein
MQMVIRHAELDAYEAIHRILSGPRVRRVELPGAVS